MRKSELKNGYGVQLRDGRKGIYLNKTFFLENENNRLGTDSNILNSFLTRVDEKFYKEDLRHEAITSMDIVKLYYFSELPFWERPKSILTPEEKNYLLTVLHPYRDRVNCIIKYPIGDLGILACIMVDLDNSKIDSSLPSKDNFNLPLFLSNTMYKGMELNKKYTLSELEGE